MRPDEPRGRPATGTTESRASPGWASSAVAWSGANVTRPAESGVVAAVRVSPPRTNASSPSPDAAVRAAVALQAAATEPDLAAASHAGRRATRDNVRAFWDKMAADGLLPPGHDLDWLTDTTAVLVHAETYLLARDMIGCDPGRYEDWLTTTLTRLLTP
ncbi:hypothetical protein [Nonomuraea sp. WAC 01424]|uniref:hypothetical protein n=1 Tax=Nonomuraea sp. WAC 01424 TaxID=2203200 RepID=UPI000F788D48|nr:hypothetical protein [Nonomuraea sp. WAC 01424]